MKLESNKVLPHQPTIVRAARAAVPSGDPSRGALPHRLAALATLTFTALIGCGTSAEDEIQRNESAVSTASPASYGFPPDTKIASRGTGSTTHELSGWPRCRPRTYNGQPCAGWASVTPLPDGRVRVDVRGIDHDGYWGAPLRQGMNPPPRFPPPATHDFWSANHGLGKSIVLDDAGRGSLEGSSGELRWRYRVEALQGKIRVRFETTRYPGRCVPYMTTCDFEVTPAPPTSAGCVVGESSPCVCANGANGMRECLSNQPSGDVFGACVCEG